MTEKQYKIRNMTQEEVSNIAIKWASEEGWNPGLYDAPCFYSADPKGFFVGLLDDEPISCISAVAYDSTFAFLGFYIVKPKYRKKGYGIKIWDTAINYLKTQNIGLDGVVEQQENYKKSGFKLAYRNIRYEGKSKAASVQCPEVVKLSEASFDSLVKYDAALFPVPRPQFLKCWINQPESLSLAVVQNDRIQGYGVIRKCVAGYKIGPLFANSKEYAEKLFLSLTSHIKPETQFYLDTPEINPEAVALAKKYGMTKVFETARMYTKTQPNIDMAKVFGVTTFELG